MSEIKAVTFDVGGTLAKGNLDRRLYESRATDYLRRSGFDRTLEDYRVAVRGALEELGRVRQDHLELKFEEFCSIILRNLSVAPSKELIDGIRSIYFECFPQTERAGSRRVLDGLSKEHDLAVVSNSMSLLPKRFLEENGLAEYFKLFVISCEVGYRKPHPRIFESALEGLGVEPGEAVHVGNLLDEDVAGAKGAGMYSVLISPRGLGEAEVKPDLVVWSIGEVPSAIANLSSPDLRKIKELLGDRCWTCSSEGVNLFRLDPEGGNDIDNFVVLCPKCRREELRKWVPRPRKRGKYRAVYRRAWSKLRR